MLRLASSPSEFLQSESEAGSCQPACFDRPAALPSLVSSLITNHDEKELEGRAARLRMRIAHCIVIPSPGILVGPAWLQRHNYDTITQPLRIPRLSTTSDAATSQ